jgi:hypothetical protein
MATSTGLSAPAFPVRFRSRLDEIKIASPWRKTRPVEGRLKVLHQIPNPDTKCFGNFQQRVNRGRLFPPFKLSNIIMMQVRFFSQDFLTETVLRAKGADAFAQKPAMFLFDCHSQDESRNRNPQPPS